MVIDRLLRAPRTIPRRATRTGQSWSSIALSALPLTMPRRDRRYLFREYRAHDISALAACLRSLLAALGQGQLRHAAWDPGAVRPIHVRRAAGVGCGEAAQALRRLGVERLALPGLRV